MKQTLKTIFLLLLCGAMQVKAQTKAKGSLFIIGGGNRTDSLIKQLLTTAGLNAKDYIVVLPMASEQPDTGYKKISNSAKASACSNIPSSTSTF